MSVTSHNNSHLFKDSNGSKPDSSLSFSATNAIISLLITSPDSNHKKAKGVGRGGGTPCEKGGCIHGNTRFCVTVNKTFFFSFPRPKTTPCAAPEYFPSANSSLSHYKEAFVPSDGTDRDSAGEFSES